MSLTPARADELTIGPLTHEHARERLPGTQHAQGRWSCPRLCDRGATAALFYAEPARTYDIDVFVVLEATGPARLLSLDTFYEWARTRGFPTDAEHIMVHGVPVQFLPAHNALAESAVTTARTLDYDDVQVRVIDPEHLVALALQAGGHKRRERAWHMIEVGAVDRQRLRTLLSTHGIIMEIDDGT
jgi:hypothetical protein